MQFTRISTVALLLCVAGLACAADAPAGVGALLGQRLAAREKVKEIGTEQNAATAEQNGKIQIAWESINLLGTATVSPERIKQIELDLIASKARVASLELQLETARISDPDARAARKKELETARDKTQAEIRKIGEPFFARMKEVRKPLQESNKDWTEALGAYFKNGTGTYADAIRATPTWFYDGDTGQVHWNDAKGQTLAWAGIFLQDKPPTTYPSSKLLDGKYPLTGSGNNIWVDTGYFKIALNINKKEWQGDEKALTELLRALIDVDGLAAIKPPAK